jgi:hypothetical protein
MKSSISVIFTSIFAILIPLSANYARPQINTTVKAEDEIIVDIKFEKQPYKLEGQQHNVINYLNAIDESKPGSPVLPAKTVIIAVPPGSKADVEFKDENITVINEVIPKGNPEVQLLSNAEVVYEERQIDPGYYQKNVYPEKRYEILGYKWIRDYYCLVLKINTHIYNWNLRQISELNSATIKIKLINVKQFPQNNSRASDYDQVLKDIICNYQNASEFRSFHSASVSDSSGNWIDFNSEYLKLGVAFDGIYRIFKTDLLNYNINTENIDPRTFKIIYKGKEIPFYISGENDGSFDDDDYIEFYGTINYADGNYRVVNDFDKPFSEYIDRYSDTSIYWLTWGGNSGLRIDTVTYNNPGIQDTINYYTETLHFEENIWFDYFTKSVVEWQNPEWLQNETWFWGSQGVSTRNWNFSVSDLVPDLSAQAFFRVLSRASDLSGDQNAHDLGLSINSNPTVYDSGFIDKYSQKVLNGVFSSNELQEGNNVLKTIMFPVEGTEINSVNTDWFDIEYPRYLKMFDDSLKIFL